MLIGKMGKWVNGKMGKWENGRDGDLSRLHELHEEKKNTNYTN
jgi:hypothetical protein